MDSAKPEDSKEQETEQPEREQAPTAEAGVEAEAAEVDELEALRREVAELREQKLRVLAEQRNQQQRAEREKAEAIKYAEADFARELLVVLDDLERTQESAQGTPDVKAFADGVRIVYEHFLKVLRGQNIEPIEAVGRPFDPGLHEAIQQQRSDEYSAGTVMQEVARGYKMHARVLRASKVIVSTGPAESEQKQPPAGQSDEG